MEDTPFLLASLRGEGRGEDRKEDAVKVQSDPHSSERDFPPLFKNLSRRGVYCLNTLASVFCI